MKSAEFKAGLRLLWGDAWRDKAPLEFDTTISTLDRWANQHVGVPGPAGRLMERLLEAEAARKTQRGYERTYKKKMRKGKGHGS